MRSLSSEQSRAFTKQHRVVSRDAEGHRLAQLCAEIALNLSTQAMEASARVCEYLSHIAV